MDTKKTHHLPLFEDFKKSLNEDDVEDTINDIINAEGPDLVNKYKWVKGRLIVKDAKDAEEMIQLIDLSGKIVSDLMWDKKSKEIKFSEWDPEYF